MPDRARPPPALARPPRAERRAGRAPARRGGAVGVLYVVASGVCFGAMPIFGRFAYRDGVDPATLLLLRFSIAAAILVVVFRARRAALPEGRSLAVLVGMGAVGYAGQAFSYFTALTLASAGLVALLLYTYPALVALLSRVVLRHPLSPAQLVGIAAALAGSALTIGGAGDGSALGVVFGLLAATIYSGYILVGSRLRSDVTPLASSTVVIGAAAVVFGAVAAVRGAHLPATAAGWAAVAALGAGVLDERVTVLRAVGGALILATVVLLARADRAG